MNSQNAQSADAFPVFSQQALLDPDSASNAQVLTASDSHRSAGGTIRKRLTTPESITPDILMLCYGLDPTTRPGYVEIRPAPGARINRRFHNAQERVRTRGGTIQYGWRVWEWPGILLQADFHAVWAHPIGKYIDVTPCEYGEPRILFHPDSVRQCYDDPPPSVTMSLIDSPTLKQYLDVSEQIAEIKRNGQRDLMTNTVLVNRADTEPLLRKQHELEEELVRDQDDLRAAHRKVAPRDQCPCGSGRTHRDCCAAG